MPHLISALPAKTTQQTPALQHLDNLASDPGMPHAIPRGLDVYGEEVKRARHESV